MLKATHNRNGYNNTIGRKTKRHFIGEYSGNGVAELKSDLGKFDFNRLKDYIGLGMSGGGMEDGLIPPESYTKFATQSNQHMQSEGSGMSGGVYNPPVYSAPLTYDEAMGEILDRAQYNEDNGIDVLMPNHIAIINLLANLFNGVIPAISVEEMRDLKDIYDNESAAFGGSKKSQYLQHLLYKDQFDIQRPQEQYRPNLEKRDRYRREQPIAPMPMMEESIAAAAQVHRPVEEPLVPSLSRARSLERIRARAASERPQLNETQYTAQQEYRFESKPEPSYVLKEQPRPPPSFKSETKTASEEAVSRPRREVPEGKDEAMPKPVRRNIPVVARSIPRVDSLQIGDLLALVDRYDDYERRRDDYHGVYRVVGKKAKTYQVELIKETMPDTPAAISMNKAPESFSVSIKQNKRGIDYLNPLYAKGKRRGNYHAFMAIGIYDFVGNVQPIDPAFFILSKNSNFRFGTFKETNE